MRGIAWGLLPMTMILACNNPVRPEDRELRILEYTLSGQANGTDPATGEELVCLFYINLRTGGPLLGTWTDTTTIRVSRIRTAPTQAVTYDTTITGQEVTLTVPDSTHIQLSVAGPFNATLNADMVAAYPGYGTGNWTCGPGHPLSRVQPDAVLTGQWHAQPFIDIPIG
jgi:hypothetical protein